MHQLMYSNTVSLMHNWNLNDFKKTTITVTSDITTIVICNIIKKTKKKLWLKKYLQWGAHRKYNEYKRTSFNLFYVFILAMSFLRKYSLFDSIVAVLAFFSTDSLGEYSNMFHLLVYLLTIWWCYSIKHQVRDCYRETSTMVRKILLQTKTKFLRRGYCQ